jgi:hypothetical protein
MISVDFGQPLQPYGSEIVKTCKVTFRKNPRARQSHNLQPDTPKSQARQTSSSYKSSSPGEIQTEPYTKKYKNFMINTRLQTKQKKPISIETSCNI